MDKKGMVFTRPRDTISFVVGIIVTAFGLIPLLSASGVIGFTIPFVDTIGVQVLIWLVAIFGAYVVVDGFIEPPAHRLHWILIIAGLILLAFGLIPILYTFGVIGFTIPFVGESLLAYQVLLTIEGIALIIGGLTEH